MPPSNAKHSRFVSKYRRLSLFRTVNIVIVRHFCLKIFPDRFHVDFKFHDMSFKNRNLAHFMTTPAKYCAIKNNNLTIMFALFTMSTFSDMALVVPSRFSSLKIVEDDYMPAKLSKAKKEEAKKPAEKKKPTKNNNQNQKTKTANGDVPQSNKKKNVGNIPSEVLKPKGDELVNKYEHDLQKALLLSKMENINLTSVNKKEVPKASEPFQVQISKKAKKKEKLTQQPIHTNLSPPLEIITHKNPFEPQEKAIKTPESPTSDELLGSQLLSVVEEKNLLIVQLKSEISLLKDELIKVKTRNKKLCSIIGQGEMKEKAEIIAEVEKLREVQSELTNEVSTLHIQLEQLKSSTAKLELKTKDKKKGH